MERTTNLCQILTLKVICRAVGMILLAFARKKPPLPHPQLSTTMGQ